MFERKAFQNNKNYLGEGRCVAGTIHSHERDRQTERGAHTPTQRGAKYGLSKGDGVCPEDATRQEKGRGAEFITQPTQCQMCEMKKRSVQTDSTDSR